MDEKIIRLIEKYGKSNQRSDDWHRTRSNLLTASEIHKAKSTATSAARRELIMSKLITKICNSGGIQSLEWGTQFEEIAKELFQKQNQIEIKDLACVIHPQHTFLGASPDGLILSTTSLKHGRLIEIKCPITREVLQDSPIPESYYDQIQLQLACTELDECEYVEYQFKKHTFTEWMNLEFIKSCFAINNKSRQVIYKTLDDERTVQKWLKSFIEDIFDWEIIYWSFNKKKELLIKKDNEWFDENLPSFKQVWEEVLEHRKNGTFPAEKTMILNLDVTLNINENPLS
jgi:putative phage-type endonuclease